MAKDWGGGRHPCGLGAVQGDHLRLLHVWAYLAACVFAKTAAVRNIWVISEGFPEPLGLVLRRTGTFPSKRPPEIKTSRLRKDPEKDDKGEQVVGSCHSHGLPRGVCGAAPAPRP